MFERSVPITLVKAASEAAVAYRTGSDVFVVIHQEYPHERKVFYSYDGTGNPREDAEAWHRSQENSDDWTIVGPIVTETEEPASKATALDFTVTVEGTGVNGVAISRTYNSEVDEVDAVFLTLPAIDKFLIPYYTHVYGIERAMEIRNQLTTKDEGPIIAHVWDSKFLPQ